MYLLPGSALKAAPIPTAAALQILFGIIVGQRPHLVHHQLGLLLFPCGDPSVDDDRLIGLKIGACRHQRLFKDQQFQTGSGVFQRHIGHLGLLFGEFHLEGHDHACQRDELAVLKQIVGVFLHRLDQPSDGHGMHPERQRLQLLHRVSRQIQTAGFPLHIEQFPAGKLGNIGQGGHRGRTFLLKIGKQVDLPFQIALGGVGFGIQHAFIDLQKLGPAHAHAVEGAASDEVFQHPLVQVIGAHPLAEIVEIPEGAVLPALLHQLFDEANTHIFHRAKAEADVVPRHGKVGAGFVDIGGQNGDPQFLGLLDVLGHLGVLPQNRGEKGGHVFLGIVIFQPRRLIGHHGVAHGVGLVEGVVCKVQHLVKDVVCHLLGHAVGGTAADVFLRVAEDEVLPLGFQHVKLLFGHGPAHHVGLAQTVASQQAENLHDLLLIDNTAVGDRKHLFQQRMLVSDGAGVVLALDVGVDVLHGAGTEQGHDSGDILHAVGLEPHGNVGHAGRFHLEHAAGLALAQHLEHRLVVVVQIFPVQLFSGLPDELDGIVDDGQVAQTQKVHLQQSQFLQGGHHVLADRALVAPGQGYILIHRGGGDDDACGVGGAVSGHALDLAGHVQQIFDAGIVLVIAFQLGRHLQGLVQGHFQLLGHQLCHHVHFGIGHIHHPSDVPDGGAGRHGAEGDDLCHVILAVFFGDVVYDLLPPSGAEVNIKVGHTDTLGVDEPLKEQAVPHGIHVGDPHTVSRHGSCARAAPRANRDALGFGVVYKIGNDEEVFHKAHPGDHVQLIAQTVFILLRAAGIAPCKALPAQLFHVGTGIALPFRELEGRQMIFSKDKVKIAQFGDFHGICKGFGGLWEQFRHLVARFDVKFRAGEPHPVFVVQGFSRLDAQQHVVHLAVLFPQIMCVVGAHQRNAGLFMKGQQAGVDGLLLGDAVILQFQIIVAPTEQLVVFQRRGLCALVIAVHQQVLHLARQTGRQADEALGMLLQQVEVNTGLVVKALGKACRAQLDEILVAGHVFTQQNQMPGLIVQLVDLVKAAAGSHVQLAADDGLDPGLFGGLVEIHAAVHDAVVCNGNGGLSQLLHPLHQRAQTAGAVQQAVFGM